MLLTEQQLYEIRQVIQDHHQAFIVNTIGADAVAPPVLQGLKDKGLVNVKVSSIEDAYLYGQLLSMMDDPKFSGMSYEGFKKHIQKNPIPLNPIELQAVQFAKQSAAQHVRGLGNRVDIATGNILIEADAAQRALLRDEIKSKTAENVAKRESVKKLKSDLGWASKDWARDWDRIAVTEKQNAMQRGVADHYAKRYGGDVRVAKRPMPDACKHCKRLHIGPDGQPRIFKLSELEANGTNVGRKANDWLPVVGTVHPHCQCQMVRVPDGWGFDDTGSLVPGGTYGAEYESAEEMQLAMLQEMDLQKAFKLAGRTKFQGIPIAIENNVGSVRKWKDGQGGEGETKMLHAYGYIERTTGADEDEVDVFLGPDPKAAQAYVVHQRNVQTDVYDEDKVMLGFSNKELALAAYAANYNRPDFVITCSPMNMDAFKRWVGSTGVKTGEMFKSGTGGLKFVVGFEKSGKLNSDVAASQSQFAGARDNPSPGTSTNYLMNVPHRKPGEKVEGVKEILDEASDNHEAAVKRDPDVYTVQEPMPRKIFPMTIPKNYHGEDEVGTGKTEERRKHVDAMHRQNQGATKNTLDPKDSKRDDLEKSSTVTPVGGTTKGGYKKVAKGQYVKVGEAKAGVQSFAVYHGGKVSAHKSDPDKIMLKVPKAKTATLQKFKESHGIAADLIQGGNYAMLAISKEELVKLEVYVEEKAKEKKAPSKKPPSKKYETEPKEVVPADAEVLRLGDIELVPKENLEPPPVRPNLMQYGTSVKAAIGGKTIKAKLAGYDFTGKPVVRVGAQRHVLEWSDVKPEGSSEYRPSYANLPPEAIVKPSATQKALVDEIMGMNVVGNHDTTEFAGWMRERGQEVHLVGGIVRDLVAGTKPESKMTKAEVLETMKDVDIVTTAHPKLGRQMFAEVSGDVHKNGILRDSAKWGVIKSEGYGMGLDFNAMATNAGIYTDDYDWDHDLEEDATRRDFTCNCLLYDTHNNVILDPTGKGLADAQHKILRLAPSQEDADKNSTLTFRFWKFRMRGFKPEEKSLGYMKQHAKKWWTTYEDKFEDTKLATHVMTNEVAKVVGNGDPKKNLEKLRKVMEDDGALDLYDKYLAPLKNEILARVAHMKAKAKKKAKGG